MNIDYKYLGILLKIISETQEPYVNSKKLYGLVFNSKNHSHSKFIFHWHIIVENGLMSTCSGLITDLKSSGLIIDKINLNRYSIRKVEIRLTTKGILVLNLISSYKHSINNPDCKTSIRLLSFLYDQSC